MPEESDLKGEINPPLKTRSCEHRIGTTECQHCVSNGICPSKIETIEQIDDIEKGRKHCFGQA